MRFASAIATAAAFALVGMFSALAETQSSAGAAVEVAKAADAASPERIDIPSNHAALCGRQEPVIGGRCRERLKLAAGHL